MKRRDFLKQTGAAAVATATAAATSLSGPFVHASDKADARNPVIGEGDHRYECFHGWGELPSSIHWFETHGVAIDKAGFIYIKHRAGGAEAKIGRGCPGHDRRLRSSGKVCPILRQGISRRRTRHRHPRGEWTGVSLSLLHVPGQPRGQDRLEGRGGLDQGDPERAARLRQTGHSLFTHQCGVRPRWRLLRWRWLRLELYPPVRQGCEVGADLRRHR